VLKILKFIILFVLSLVIIFVAMFSYLFMIRVNDIRLQKIHLEDLQTYYNNDYVEVDESQFVNFDIDDDTIKLNEVQMLASHNSYKKTGPALGRFFVGLGENFDEARALKYGYLSLTYQLENGIRSMEWDVRLRHEQFEITHVPIVDNSSVAPTVQLALEELSLFTEHNPNHLPIIIILEIKSDWMMLDPALKDINNEELKQLDQLLEDTLGNFLYRPSDFIHDMQEIHQFESTLSMSEVIKNYGWPSIQSLLGKYLFVIHASGYTTPYYEQDTSFNSQAMFLSVYASQIERPYASFVVHNTPDVEIIRPLVNQNFIVRTRIDSNLIFEQSRFQTAIESGAQILTSDFTIGRSDLSRERMITLETNKMIVLNKND
jgi:hypothetical protein